MSEMHLPLSSGALLPAVGLGFWKVAQSQVAALVVEAAQVGYRHFDCACDYGNEAEVGAGLQQAVQHGICRREEMWVTSKLWNTYHAPEHVRPAVERSLRDLRLDYLDLYLVHFPIAQQFVPFEERYPPGWFYDPAAAQPCMKPVAIPQRDTWEAMEELVKLGLVKHIGVSNFNCSLLRDLLTSVRIRPEVLQVELHPYLTQEKLLRFCQEQQIAVTAFSPLGAASYFSLQMAEAHEAVLEQPIVQAIARAHRKTPAQVVLRWGVQRGTAVIPKTSQYNRLRENLAIYDFSLQADEMQAIAALNRHRRFNDPGDFCERAFGTYFPIYD
jgi:D-xylose reductase